jgi:hypothetical protein
MNIPNITRNLNEKGSSYGMEENSLCRVDVDDTAFHGKGRHFDQHPLPAQDCGRLHYSDVLPDSHDLIQEHKKLPVEVIGNDPFTCESLL